VLREEAARLLEACERAAHSGGLFAMPAAALAAGLSSRAPGTGVIGALISERYVVERELGRGGMAVVYLARDLRHDREVAVKVLEAHVAPEGAGRFLREIRIAAGLTHPHVLGLHDSGESEGRLYYVMPYVAGETLRSRLTRTGALPLADAVRLVRELADALAYAHEQGVVHRDLKPENVLLSGGHAVVADFGIAKALAAATGTGSAAPNDRLTATGVAIGTPAYMAPEQMVGDATMDHRVDLYALGLVAYEILTGAHPFAGRTAPALASAQLTETPRPVAERRPDVPPALTSLVTQLLAKDPAARPRSAADVLGVLDGLVSGPTTVHRRRRRARIIAVAAVLLAAVAVGAYALHSKRAPAAVVAPSAGRMIAVLPFANTGGSPDDDYFSDGLTDELAHALAHVPGLRVAGHDASYTFKGKHVVAQEVGRVLGVGAFISATVRRSGDRLRVSPQLVSTADGAVLWDSVYESRSGDVFAVQDSLTRAVAAALAPALGIRDVRSDRGQSATLVDVGRGTKDREAYDLYLQGRYYWHERGATNVARSIGYFQRAIARDPAFARAYAALAFAYDVLSVYVPDPSDSAGPLITASARRAMTLDSTLADAQLATALALARELQLEEAEVHFRAALRIEPSNGFAHHAFGNILVNLGHTDSAIAELRKATQLDPLAKSAGTLLAEALINARQFPEAVTESRRVLAIDSTFPLALNSLGFAQTLGGHPDSAVRTLERLRELHPETRGLEARRLFAYAAAGRWGDAERVRARLHKPGGDLSGGVETAFADFVFGDKEPLIRVLTTRDGQRRWFDTFVGIACNPFVDPLWADTRYRAAMRDLGVAPCPQARPWPLPQRNHASRP
jgi:serine/threonine-protein kinase